MTSDAVVAQMNGIDFWS